MIETIKEFFAASPVVAWSVVSVMVAMGVMAGLWEKIKWWWLNTWMSFPLIGRIVTLSRDINRDANDNAWFKAEKTLCGDYKKFIRVQDEHDFNEKIEYISKAGDNGRTPMPKWIWILTTLLVFVEAMGFSYVLAGFTIPGASENLQQYGALGIAFLISVLLVAFTHLTGHELFVSTQMKHARREWVEDGRKNKLRTGEIPLAGKIPQSSDDNQPNYTQLANRVGTHESYKITGVTIILVLIVAIGATYVRGQVLEKILHEDVIGKSSVVNSAITAGSDALNMAVKAKGNSALPDSDIAQNQVVKDKAITDETNIDRHGGWGTFIVLAFIFVFLQILGVVFGFRWGFAGKFSADAYKALGSGRYITYADVREHYREIADTAQAKLERLQQMLMDNNATGGGDGMHTKKTFYDYMKLTRQDESNDSADQRQHTTQKVVLSQAAAVPPLPPVAPPVTPVIETSTVATLPTVDEAVRQLQSLLDQDAKKEYVRKLPQPLQGDVIKANKAAKEAEKANAAQLESELNDL